PEPVSTVAVPEPFTVQPVPNGVTAKLGLVSGCCTAHRVPLCWLELVTVTLTAPGALAGVVAVIVVLFTTVTLLAAALPNVTVAPLAKLAPVMVTEVPPAAAPEVGEMLATV